MLNAHRRRLTARFLLLLALLLAGCASRVTTVHITNDTGAEIRNIEVEFPGGSYGIPHLAPGKTHDARIKPMADKPLNIAFVDATNQQHRSRGPLVKKDITADTTIHITAEGLRF